MGRITVDAKGEHIKPPILPEGWYEVFVETAPTLEVGKESGKKYLLWKTKVKSGKFAMTPLGIRTTLEKGDDPLKSKRWLFHQIMAACGIEKNADEKYSFDLAELQGKEFYVRLIVKEESYNDNVFEKNEVKQIALEPTKKKEVQATEVTNGVFPEVVDTEEIPF